MLNTSQLQHTAHQRLAALHCEAKTQRSINEPMTIARTKAAPTRRGFFRRLRNGLLGLGITLLALVGLGAIYQALGTFADKRAYPAPGQLVDVGGYKLHLNCTGEGSPTVVLETLSGGLSSYWAWVQPELAAHTRVCSYDRAGRGWSEASPVPMSAKQTARDLHTLLENAPIPGPYVLVGHSIGGLYVRSYEAQYPDEVVGMVLLDASHPELFSRDPDLLVENQAFSRQSALFPTLARLGVFRLFFALGADLDFRDLPTQQHAEVTAFWSSPRYLLSQRTENAAIFAETKDLGTLEDLPLIVITAKRRSSPMWLELQDELATLSTNSFHLTMAEASHTSLVFNPDHAQDTSKAILQVVEAARTGQSLVPTF
jgi:pimeloyl-ACP methyl ester carboxylesterase